MLMGRRPAGQVGVWVALAVSLVGAASAAAPVGPPTGLGDPAPAVGVEPARRSDRLESRPLGPARQETAQTDRRADTSPAGGSTARTVMALAVVIGAIFGARFVIRALTRGAGGLAAQIGPAGRAPSGVLTVLARYPVARGQTLVLLQMNGRVLLLSQSSHGFATLAEISDPREVADLIRRARDEEGSSLSARFSALLKRLEREPTDGAEHLIGRGPTTVSQALRMFPETRRDGRLSDARAGTKTGVAAGHQSGVEALAAIRRRLADLEGAGP
ncbi:MAG: hypothetical protein D6693_02595 [Planctomycetota bacterium]|nr:MAG: hypothetical protein D6693_02595 [Planctomycetota bacterium]